MSFLSRIVSIKGGPNVPDKTLLGWIQEAWTLLPEIWIYVCTDDLQ